MTRTIPRNLLLLAPLLLAACLAPAPGLSPADRADVLRYAPGADLDNLSQAQVNALSAALHDGDGLSIEADIRAILQPR
jgi:hypothetical protein